MQKAALIVAFLIPVAASATDLARCGTDQFGNSVCLDKDGVLSARSAPVAAEGKGAAVSGVSAADGKPGREEAKGKLRCGTDQFGNTVCQ